MPIQPIKGMDEFKRLKESLKNRFDSERSGEQVFQREQTKAFEPLINIQKETSKATQDKIVSAEEARNNALVPLVQEMQRRNDQIDMLASQPFYQQQQLPDIPEEEVLEDIRIDLDKNLNDSDIQNLNDMSYQLPSVLFGNKSTEEVKDALEATLDKIKTKEHSLRGFKSSGKSRREGKTEMYTSQYKTLRKYEERLKHIGTSLNLIASTPKKITGEGLKSKKGKSVDVIICSNSADIYQQLQKFCTAKEAGNTGVDNHINSCLDKLLKEKAIDMDDYKNLYKEIFH